MKIIFDSEEQKKLFIDTAGFCPCHIDFNNVPDDECWAIGTREQCYRCWEQSGIEIEVKEKTDEDCV